jgi:RsiW-degrading membrane proteinase PrsW (M82 family)
MIAASLAFAGVLVLPSVWFAWKHLSAPEQERSLRQEVRGFGLILTLIVMVVVPGSLWIGNLVSQKEQLTWFLLPLLNITVNGLSALWLVYVAIRGLTPGKSRHVWGIFSSGLVLSPIIVLTLELLALAGFGLLVFLWAMQNPGVTSQLQGLFFRLQHASPNPDVVLRILSPYLFQPGMVFIAFSFISVIVPIIEEVLKPIGVWFLARQNLNPAQGFVYGVLCGVGFGLFENLGNTSVGGEAWAILASTRISTLLLHCLTTGMVGWALASAWSEKRYLRLATVYVVAVLLHGVWNGMAVLTALTSLEDLTYIDIPAGVPQVGNYAAIGVAAMGVFNLFLYFGFNTFLRRSRYSTILQQPSAGETSNLPVTGSYPFDQGESTPPNSGISKFFSSAETGLSTGDQPHIPDNDHPPTKME